MAARRAKGLLIGGFAACVAAAWVIADYWTVPRLVNGPMVQTVTASGFRVVWESHPDKQMSVRIRGADGAVLRECAAALQAGRWHAAVEGLAPATEYLYEITYALPLGHAGLLARYPVHTTPAAAGGPVVASGPVASTQPAFGTPIRVLAFGDSGDGSRSQFRLARLMPRYRPDLIVHTGDLVYPAGAAADYRSEFFNVYADMLVSVPFYPCLGNHDVRSAGGRPLLEAFDLPANGPPGHEPEREYWFDYSDVRFVALDSNLDEPQLRDEVAPWLERVLAGAGDRWQIVFFHEPVYTNARYPNAYKLESTIAPLLDRHHVQLVLSGHNHLYERTRPIRGGQVVAPGTGTVYITTGAGGANLHPEHLPAPAYIAAFHDAEHSFTLLDVTADQIAIRQISESGTQIDEAWITRRAASQPSPLVVAR